MPQPRKLWDQLWDQAKPKARATRRPKRLSHKKREDRIDFASLKPNIAENTDGVDNLFRGIKTSAAPWLRENKELATEVHAQILAAGSNGLTTGQLSNHPKRKAAYRLAIVGLVKADTLDKDAKTRRYIPI